MRNAWDKFQGAPLWARILGWGFATLMGLTVLGAIIGEPPEEEQTAGSGEREVVQVETEPEPKQQREPEPEQRSEERREDRQSDSQDQDDESSMSNTSEIDEEPLVHQAVIFYEMAIESGDAKSACELMTPAAQRQAMGKNYKSCEEAIRAAHRALGGTAMPLVEDVVITGNRAKATMAETTTWMSEAVVMLRKNERREVGNQWMIDASP